MPLVSALPQTSSPQTSDLVVLNDAGTTKTATVASLLTLAPQVSYGTPGTTQNLLVFGNNYQGNSQTFIGPDSTTAISGISGIILKVSNNPFANLLTLDQIGNVGAAGGLYAASAISSGSWIGNTSQGLCAFGSANSLTRYLLYNGSQYVLNGASLVVNGTTYPSSRNIKHSISGISFDSVSKIKALNVVSFKYRSEIDIGGANPEGKGDNDQRTHHGIIAEDSPSEFLSPDGKGMEGHTALAIALDAIKQLTLRIEKLENAAPV